MPSSKDKKILKWRRLYTFECRECGRPRAKTIKYRVSQEKVCKVCRRKEVSENQLGLFPDDSVGKATMKLDKIALFGLPTESSYMPIDNSSS